ncbi:hypothetical protein [Actinoallomurus acanthiterrae]
MTALIASATILVIILATDLGRKRVTNMRILRSFIAVAIVIAIFVHSLPTGGNDLWLQLVGLVVGAVFGLIAGALLPAHRDPSGLIYTTGGVAYALLWLALSSGRVIFAYGTEHWFGPDILRFSIENKLSGQDVYANAFIFMSLAMVLGRSAVLFTRRRRLRVAGEDAPSPATATAGSSAR